MTRESALVWLIRIISQALPDLAEWGDAMGAELQAIPTRGERVAFAASSLRGLAAIALSRQLLRWQAHTLVLLAAAGLGIVVATVDLHVDSRWPLRVGVLLSSAAVGWMRPSIAWSGGVLAGLGLPIVVIASDYRGPYSVDRGDIWFPLFPALIIAAFVAALRRQSRPPRTS